MLRIIKLGFFTTIQDKGRFGFREKGIPVSGTMDDLARHRINTLLENKENAPVLEITMTGPTVVFNAPTFICLGGAVFSATLNNKAIANYVVYRVNKGDVLAYGKLVSGFRGYLAVKKGFAVAQVLGSASQYVPVTAKHCIQNNDEIGYEAVTSFEPKLSNLKIGDYLRSTAIKASLGPEFELLTDNQQQQLLATSYTIAKENNRMAYQLEEKLEEHSISMLTSATLPGTVQLTSSGKLIVLMKDGQTTGGYPRVLQLTKEGIAVLAQKKAGDSVQFVMH